MSNILKFFILVILSTILAHRAFAEEYANNLMLARIRINTAGVYVGMTRQPGNTCSMWGEFLKFDHTTSHGKSLLAMLVVAKTSEEIIEIWYTPSANPNTNETNGCDNTSMAVLTGVAIGSPGVSCGIGQVCNGIVIQDNKCIGACAPRICQIEQACIGIVTSEGGCAGSCVTPIECKAGEACTGESITGGKCVGICTPRICQSGQRCIGTITPQGWCNGKCVNRGQSICTRDSDCLVNQKCCGGDCMGVSICP